jgi:DNA helicase-2/ATP-dependent DNA helicase PcrA
VIYTEKQQAAIDCRNTNLLILACAGSGKTEVISRRIAELVQEGTLKNSIIAFTFTERAANELKARIRLHLEKLQPDDPSLGDMYVGTIHSFCLHLIKEIDPNYRKYEVMDEARQAALIMTQFNYTEGINRGIGLNRLRHRSRTGGYWDTVGSFITTLNVIHQKSISLESIPDIELRSTVERYRQIAHGSPNFFFDFDQIINELLDKLKTSPSELENVRNKFKHLVVDEYQDVDDRQEELIALITNYGKDITVTAVGDDDQAIYGWRGAKVDNILKFENRYSPVTKIELTSNFRSTHAIVEIANNAIRSIPPGKRWPKDMVARHCDENANPPKFVETMAEMGDVQLRTFKSDDEEANWIADRIKQLLGTVIQERDDQNRAIHYADFAILLRSVRSSGNIFASALTQRGIPVVVKGTGGLFEHEEVLLVQAAFCLLARSSFMIEDEKGFLPRDEAYTREFIRNVIRQLREKGAMPFANEARFLEWIAAKRENLDRRNLEKEQRGKLARRIYPQDLFQEMLYALGSAEGNEPWPEEILYNLGRLSALITQFESVHQWITPKDLTSLCIFLGGWAADQVDEGGADEVSAPNAVQILTVHAAKGLEWPVVFLPRISSSIFPSSMRTRGPETFLPSSLFDPKDYASGDEGERRLWYVAITRCRKFLHITSQDRLRKKPTDFYKEIKHDYVQRNGIIPDREKGIPTAPSNVELLPTTYSDLSYYWRCPFEYQLRALMGFGPGVEESYGYGQQIHNILAELHKVALAGTILSPSEVDDLVESRFHLRYTRDGETFKPLTLLKEAAKRSLKRYLEAYPDYSTYVLESEKPFEFLDQESGALISGSIDLLERVDITPEGKNQYMPVEVVDFKTHKWKDLATYNKTRSDVELQLRLYAIAVRHALHFEASRAKAHFLSHDAPPSQLKAAGVEESIIVDVSPERQQEVRVKVGEAVKGIRESVSKGRFKLSGCENGHCEHCDFKEFCPGFVRWRRSDKTTPRPLSPEERRVHEMQSLMEELDAG